MVGKGLLGDRTLRVTQEPYVHRITDDPKVKPQDLRKDLFKLEALTEGDLLDEDEHTRYRSQLGEVGYASVNTRKDTAAAHPILGEHQNTLPLGGRIVLFRTFAVT